MLTTKVKNITYFLKQNGQLFFLSLLCLYSAILQFFWLRLDKTPPWGDGIPCILRGMHFFQVQDKLRFWEFIKEMFGFGDSYPPLVDFSYFVYYRLFGLSSEMELMVNSVYLIIGIIGVYGIGKCLFNKNTGLFSALIFTSLPGVLIYSKLGFKEFQLMCFLALTIYFLLASKIFTNRKFSLLFAVSLGLMTMIKYEGLIFLIMPLTIVFTKVISDRTFPKNLYWFINLILVLIIASLIGLSWYIVNWQEFSYYIYTRFNSASTDPIIFSTKDITFYFKGLCFIVLTRAYISIFAIICIYSILNMLNSKTGIRRDVRMILFLYLCFAFPLLIFTFTSSKNFSHILPLLVFTSVIIAWGCSSIKNKFIKFALIGLISFHAVNSQLVPVFYKINDFPLAIKLSPIDHFLRYKYGICYNGYTREPLRDGWDVKLKQLLNFIEEDYYGSKFNNYSSGSKKPSVFLVVNNYPFRYYQVHYYNMKKYSPVKLVGILNQISREDFFRNRPEFIVTEVPFLYMHITNDEDDYIKDMLKFIEDNKERFYQSYRVAREFKLPRSSKVVIYKRDDLYDR